MLKLTISADAPDPQVIAAAAGILRRGGIVAYPTDTLYGLAVDPRLDAAAARLFEVKGRADTAAIPLVAADLDQAQATGVFDEAALRLAGAFWPGPLTLVVPARPGISPRVLAGGTTIGVRVPAHAVARALAGSLGSAITATSANPSGAAPPASAAALDPALAAALDAIVDAGPAPGGAPSTIVDVSGGAPRLLRAGPIAWERVLRSAAGR